jgi:hypothetical protein
VWTRLILPNGNSIVIDNLPATDAPGYAGLEDEVDFHAWQLLKGIGLATLLGVGTQLTLGNDEGDLIKALRESMQQTTNRAGQRLIERQLDVQPTITVRSGWPVRLIKISFSKCRSAGAETEMKKMRLSKLPDRVPVKLTITLAPDLAARLRSYADLYAEIYATREEPADLVPYMFDTFLKADVAFRRTSRSKGNDGTAESPPSAPSIVRARIEPPAVRELPRKPRAVGLRTDVSEA